MGSNDSASTSSLTRDYFDTHVAAARSRYALARAFREITGLLPVDQTIRLLDLGCGAGDFAEYYCRTRPDRLFGIDFSLPPLIAARHRAERLSAIQGDVTRLPFTGQSFDAIVIINVLHHLDSIEQNLRHFHALLKPGGILCALEPNIYSPYQLIHCLRHPQLERNTRRFSTGYLNRLLRSSPFTEVAIKRINVFPTFFNNEFWYGIYDRCEQGMIQKAFNRFAMHHLIVARRPELTSRQ